MPQKERIHAALVNAAMTGPFYRVSYDSTTRQMQVDRGGVLVEPASAIVQEEAVDFVPPRRHRRTHMQERRGWRWAMALYFAVEVSTQDFEDVLLEQPIVIPRDPATGDRQVTLRMQGASYSHPPQQSPGTGTRIRLTFEADEMPA